MLPDGEMPPPPFELVDNQQTWLDQTDLVFIDPVGTGFSRPAKKELGKKFWSVDGDIASVGDFIRLYLTRYERWNSPLFLVGESYGTTRAAGLSGYLVNHGIALNGVVLISSVLNFQTLEAGVGNDLPYILFLPSFTSSAWYHKKLPADLQQQDLATVLTQVEQYAAGPYTLALGKGSSLTAQERDEMITQVSRFTGLDRTTVDVNNGRISEPVFTTELMKAQKLELGRLDSRFTGTPVSGRSARGYYDPSESAIRPPFTATFNNYVRGELGFKTDLEYYVLGGGVGQWEWGSAGEGYPDTSEALRLAFIKNPIHEAVCGVRLLRLGDALLRHALHAESHGTGPAAAGANQPGLLRRRTHDVHQGEFAGPPEAGCVGVFGEGVAVESRSWFLAFRFPARLKRPH